METETSPQCCIPTMRPLNWQLAIWTSARRSLIAGILNPISCKCVFKISDQLTNWCLYKFQKYLKAPNKFLMWLEYNQSNQSLWQDKGRSNGTVNTKYKAAQLLYTSKNETLQFTKFCQSRLKNS